MKGATAIHNHVKEIVDELNFIQERFFDRSTADLVRMAECVADVFRRDGKLLILGTGTSGQVAQVLASAFTHQIAVKRPPLPAIALNTDGSQISGLAESVCVEDMFTRQVQALGSKGDMVVAFSWDGESPAALRALVAARENGLETAAFLGRDGGKMKNYTELAVVVDSEQPGRVHEVHLVAAHIVAQLVERRLFSL